MPLLPPKAVFAIAAVTDIALNAGTFRVRSRALAMRLGLSERYLEPVLQALVRHNILESATGARGGYQLARQARHITAENIVRASGTAAETDISPDAVFNTVVLPVLAEAEEAFYAELAHINVEDSARSAAVLGNLAAE